MGLLRRGLRLVLLVRVSERVCVPLVAGLIFALRALDGRLDLELVQVFSELLLFLLLLELRPHHLAVRLSVLNRVLLLVLVPHVNVDALSSLHPHQFLRVLAALAI